LKVIWFSTELIFVRKDENLFAGLEKMKL